MSEKTDKAVELRRKYEADPQGEGNAKRWLDAEKALTDAEWDEYMVDWRARVELDGAREELESAKQKVLEARDRLAILERGTTRSTTDEQFLLDLRDLVESRWDRAAVKIVDGEILVMVARLKGFTISVEGWGHW